jgi:hypothetical protein
MQKESELANDENTAGLLRLVCDVRFALGDDGKRMQEELIEFCAEMRKDAERYRWLRAQHWSTSPLCVVADPKDAVKLGRTCPSGEYLDFVVDDAMALPMPPNVRANLEPTHDKA